MALGCRVCALALIAIAAGPAMAQTEAQLALSAASGYTDNALGAATDAPLGMDQPDRDVYFTVTPTLRVWRETSRLVLVGAFGAAVSRYLSASKANSLDVHGTTQVDYLLSSTERGSLALNASYLDVPVLNPEGIVGAVPTGGGKLFTVGTTVGAIKDFSKSWRGIDEMRLAFLVPVGSEAAQRSAVSVGNAVGAQYSFKRDALDGRVDLGMNRFAAGEGAMATPGQTDYTLGLTGTWLRELDPFWGLLVTGGATLAFVAGNAAVAPVAKAAITRTGERWLFSAAVGQSVQANLLVAQTFSTSDATASIQTAMGDRMSLVASAGAAHARSLGGDGGPSISSLRSSARLDYRLRENFAISLSHEFVFQSSGARTVGGESEVLLRNNVVLALTAYWPTAKPRVIATEGILLRVRQSEERDRAEREGSRADDEE